MILSPGQAIVPGKHQVVSSLFGDKGVEQF